MISMDLAILRGLLTPSLELHLSSEWSSNSPDHRKLLRAFIADHLCLQGEARKEVCDLTYPPQTADKKISLAHSLHIGVVGFADVAIGVDIEQTSRVTEKIVERISSKEEMKAAPSVADLWVAKEAAFKALYNYEQPQIMSQVEIGAWQKHSSQIEIFHVTNVEKFSAPHGVGAIWTSGLHKIAIFVFLP